MAGTLQTKWDDLGLQNRWMFADHSNCYFFYDFILLIPFYARALFWSTLADRWNGHYALVCARAHFLTDGTTTMLLFCFRVHLLTNETAT